MVNKSKRGSGGIRIELDVRRMRVFLSTDMMSYLAGCFSSLLNLTEDLVIKGKVEIIAGPDQTWRFHL